MALDNPFHVTHGAVTQFYCITINDFMELIIFRKVFFQKFKKSATKITFD